MLTRKDLLENGLELAKFLLDSVYIQASQVIINRQVELLTHFFIVNNFSQRVCLHLQEVLNQPVVDRLLDHLQLVSLVLG